LAAVGQKLMAIDTAGSSPTSGTVFPLFTGFIMRGEEVLGGFHDQPVGHAPVMTAGAMSWNSGE
ncbi:hypothetical protein R5O87_22095, partial [Arthrobacter globiformis]|uniref:hypothetical protein n=1 Tax=Arthrobacter globiformis TaxID=1665 RepID=UPI00397DAE2D